MLHRLTGATGRRLVVAVPLVWLAVFFLLPLLETLQVSFTTAQRSIRLMRLCGDLTKLDFYQFYAG